MANIDIPLISIIIPCYNGEKYIKNTLKSILLQQEKNFEILLIDDGSTDNSVNMINDVLRDTEIKYELIKQDNKGVGIARNKGLYKAKGKYVYFLDCDDTIESNFTKLVANNVSTNPEMLFFSYDVNENGDIYRPNYLLDNLFKQSGKSILQKILKEDFRYHLCSVVILKDFIYKNNIKFSNFSYGEDSEFIFKAVIKSSNVTILNDVIYHYNVNSNSVTQKFSKKRLDSIYAAISISKYISEETSQKDINKLINKYVCDKMLYQVAHFHKAKRNNIISDDLYKEFIKLINSNRKFFKYYNCTRSMKIVDLAIILILLIDVKIYVKWVL